MYRKGFFCYGEKTELIESYFIFSNYEKLFYIEMHPQNYEKKTFSISITRKNCLTINILILNMNQCYIDLHGVTYS